MSFHVTYNFVQGYDLGQKKIVASEVDQNFSDIEGYINNSSVNLADPQTITGDKVFTGTVDLSGATVISSDNIPVGSIIWSANASVPAGYLLCNGASVGRDTYPELFAAIGTTYGDGDGSTTFNLPNLIGRFIEGASTAGTVKAAGVPNIAGGFSIAGAVLTNVADAPAVVNASGPFTIGVNVDAICHTGASAITGHTLRKVDFNANTVSSVYSPNVTTVQPPSVTALPCIKAFSAVIGDATVVAAELVDDIMARTDPAQAAHAAMPSGQYISYSIGPTGSTIVAPGDGYVVFRGSKNGVGAAQLALNNTTKQYEICNSNTAGWLVDVSIPCNKNDVILYSYVEANNNLSLRFYYANGSAPTI